jgi:DNA-binding NtrC family response regulator
MRPPYSDPTANAPQRALVADDEPHARELLGAQLRARGYEVATAAGAEEAIDALEDFAPHLVLADVELPDGDRPLVAAVSQHRHPPAALILLARRELVPAAIRGLAAGADGYLTKPVDAEQLALVAEQLMDHRRLRARVASMRTRLDGHPALRRLVGDSAPIEAVRAALAQAAESTAPVLIRGERGTGKRLAAELLHQSRAPGGPFVHTSCVALTTGALESELENARGGTLFLDDVADLPPPVQEALAEVLASGGGGRTEGTGARRSWPSVCVVAATSRDLAAAADAVMFSGELFQLLRSVTVSMPPLRERRHDIPLLVDHFRRRVSGEGARELGRTTMEGLVARPWPGNVGELERLVGRLDPDPI